MAGVYHRLHEKSDYFGSGRTFWDYGRGINKLEWNLQTTDRVLERAPLVSECRVNSHQIIRRIQNFHGSPYGCYQGKAAPGRGFGAPMRNALTLLALTSISLFMPARTPAQTKPATCADWFAVQSWNGTVTYSGSGKGSLPNGTSQTISESATVSFTTAKGNQGCDVNGDFSNFVGIDWSTAGLQSITYHVTVHDTFTSTQDNGHGGTCTATTNWDVANGTSSLAGAHVDMTFGNATSGTYTVRASEFVDGVTETINGCANSTTQTTNFYTWGPTMYPSRGVPLPAAIGPVSG